MDEADRAALRRAYWNATRRLTVALLIIWFSVSYGAGILFRDFLDQWSVGGAPLGFWFAQQGSMYVFLILILVYALVMDYLDRKHDVKE